MRKLVVFIGLFILSSGLYQILEAQDTRVGGGIYNTALGNIASIRLEFQEKYLLDFGLSFTTIDANNFTVAFRGAGRFYEIDDVHIHGGLSLGLTDINNDTAFQFGVLIGAESFISDAFSVTADVFPIQIQANGDAEALFLRGGFGLNVYFQ
jgi:hypothetical protein